MIRNSWLVRVVLGRGTKIKKKVSVGQIMAELICRSDLENQYQSYKDFSDSWNPMPLAIKNDIVAGVRDYLERQIGKENVEQ